MNDEANEEMEEMGDEIGDLMAQVDESIGEEAEVAVGTEVAEVGDVDGGAEEGAGDEEVNVDLIMDLPLEVVVELGRAKMLINDLLQIGQGSVIELNKQVGEALDVLVNGKLVARGEVVVVKDKFGVRITEVLSTIERIKQLA
ncbi:flagellar motor switch protein FliN [Nitrospinota bacterium]